MVLRLIERTVVLLVSLAVSSVLVFAFMAVLPGDPARVALGVNASDEAVAELRRQFGLDRSLSTQYFDWLGGLLRGDFGTSYVSKAAIGPQIFDRFQVTLWLVVVAMVIALVIAVPAGTVMAARHRRVSGLALSALSQVGVAVPAFLAGILLIMLFAVKLGWLPANGWTPPAEDPEMFLRQLILPALSLGLVQGAVLTRYVRSAVLDVLREDYLRTARAKGLRPFPALWRHGLRNAAVPVVTVLGSAACDAADRCCCGRARVRDPWARQPAAGRCVEPGSAAGAGRGDGAGHRSTGRQLPRRPPVRRAGSPAAGGVAMRRLNPSLVVGGVIVGDHRAHRPGLLRLDPVRRDARGSRQFVWPSRRGPTGSGPTSSAGMC